jgi:tetraacyldisaccharide 4'-kinase
MATASLPALCQSVHRLAGQRPVAGMTMVAEALWQRQGRVMEGVAQLRGCRVVAFAGIGNPPAFATTLAQLGSEVVALLAFPDHYPYTTQDWQAIVDIARQQQAACLVTTEKDAVRLAPCWQAPIPVYALRIGVRFLQEPPALQQQLEAVMADA